MSKMPEWAREIYFNYLTGNYHQFLIEGNTFDMDFIPDEQGEGSDRLLTVREIVIQVLKDLEIGYFMYYSLSTGLVDSKKGEGGQSILPLPVQRRTRTVEGDEEILTKVRPNRDEPQKDDVRTALAAMEEALLGVWRKKRTERMSNDQCPMTNEEGFREKDHGEGTKPTRVGVILDDLEKIAPERMSEDLSVRYYRAVIKGWGLNPAIRRDPGHISILFAESSAFLPHDLRDKQSGICCISVPLPDFGKRKKYFEWIGKGAVGGSPLDDYLVQNPVHAAELATMTKGFRLVDCQMLVKISRCDSTQARDFFLCPPQGDEPSGEAPSEEKVRFYLSSQKNVVIRSASRGLLEPMEASLDFDDIGGLEGPKDYFKKVAEAIKSEDGKARKIIPKGVLLAGPPGTGKTILARALAKETNLNLVRMGNIRSMWVGESERNMSLVLTLLKAMAPVIVFVDEIDQALGARATSSGDSGVSGRIFQQILEFMGDNANRGDVIWIAATNRADLLDDALVSRFDRVIPVLLPGSIAEWSSVLRGIFRQLQLKGELEGIIKNFLEDEENNRKLADHSGRSMETVVRFAYQNMLQRGVDAFDLEDLQSAFINFKTNIDRAEYRRQLVLAVASCNDMRFITRPEDQGYSYGDEDLNEAVKKVFESRSNAPLDEILRALVGTGLPGGWSA